MSRRALSITGLVIGAIMVALGVFIVLRLVVTPGRTFTGRPWLDAAFAAFFIIRGGMHFARVRRQGMS